MPDVLSAATLGVVAGLGVAVPLGAIGVLLLRTAMTDGWRPAAAGGLGAATVDLVYATVAVLAGTAVTSLLDGHERAVRIVGAVVLAAIAVRGLLTLARGRSAPDAAATDERTVTPATPPATPPATRGTTPATRGTTSATPAALPATSATTPAATFARFVALTAINPLTAVYFAVVAAGFAERLAGPTQRVAFVAGVAVASAAWQLTLVAIGAAVGFRAGPRVRIVLGAAGDVVVLALAVGLALA